RRPHRTARRRGADGARGRGRAGAGAVRRLGSVGTGYRFWRALRRSGAEVRAFHPILSGHPFDIFVRDHRKVVVADGARAMVGGLCTGNEWAGVPATGREAGRDTMLRVCGPAAAALARAFAEVWQAAGPAIAPEELAADPAECGGCAVRVVGG